MKFFLILFLFFFTSTFAQDLTVERITKTGDFYAKGVAGFTSLPDGEHFTKIVNENGKTLLKKYSFTDFKGAGTVLVDLSTIQFEGKPLEFEDAILSSSGNYLTLTSKTEAIYRHSFSTIYYIYTISSKKCVKLDKGNAPQTLATFSPDEKKIAYVKKNDLYVYDLASDKTTQITKDGKRNQIINGTTDWVYEEEFAITQGFSWSPDSKFIAFMRFDESKVKEFQMAMYGELYPNQYKFKYPKAGEDNSKVTFHLTDVKSGKVKTVSLGEFEYLPRFEWSPVTNEVIVLTMNRHQNELTYHLVSNMKKPCSKVIFKESSKTYIDIDNNLDILADGKSLIRTSESNGYNHIYQLNFDGTQRQITTGNWDIIEYQGIDEKTSTLFFASAENGAINRVLSSIKLDGSNKQALSAIDGTHYADYSTGFKYFIRNSSTANTVPTYTLCDRTGKELTVLEDNNALQKRLDDLKVVKKEFLQVPGADGTLLNAWIMKPADFSPEKQYPVYFTIYCGPGYNTVTNEFEGSSQIYHELLTRKGYIVVSVDPRGTMYRGEQFKKCTYLQLGKYETEDIIAAAQFIGHMPYVNPNRIGVQGWSYGGFMTALCMTKGAEVFKMGISVAPVTSWRYYDNIYTERFMQTPQENASGYDDNSPINHVAKLKGKFLLIHGSADDNVHYQNTMELITAMVKANKQFDLFIYPDKNHGIYGGNTRNHLFTKMLNYTLENL
ncbi:MAG: S9 family peptidase [Fluviicola sp.]